MAEKADKTTPASGSGEDFLEPQTLELCRKFLRQRAERAQEKEASEKQREAAEAYMREAVLQTEGRRSPTNNASNSNSESGQDEGGPSTPIQRSRRRSRRAEDLAEVLRQARPANQIDPWLALQQIQESQSRMMERMMDTVLALAKVKKGDDNESTHED